MYCLQPTVVLSLDGCQTVFAYDFLLFNVADATKRLEWYKEVFNR
jgi:hypothetical protein